MDARLSTSGPFGAKFPRYELLYPQPSPIEPLANLVDQLMISGKDAAGEVPNLWIKREDSNSGLAEGGNKLRKLEYVLPDAIAKRATVLVTTGGQQSNHMRQVAAAAARAGLEAKLVPRNTYDTESFADRDQYESGGNVQLTELLSANRAPTVFDKADVDTTISNVCQKLNEEGERPYYIPPGASTHRLGGLGYAHFAFEVCRQEQELGFTFDCIYVACNGGSTLAGMIAGFKLLHQLGNRTEHIRLVGVATAPVSQTDLETLVLRITRNTASLIGVDDVNHSITADDVVIDFRYHAGGYGRLNEDTHRSIKLLATAEGILLDPVYTGKAFTGLLYAARRPGSATLVARRQNWLFVHTGGTNAIGVYPTLR